MFSLPTFRRSHAWLAILGAGLTSVAVGTTAQATTLTLSGVDVNAVGSAVSVGNGVQLANDYYQAGGVWQENTFATGQSFRANFTFSLQNNGPTPQADGLAFVIQNDPGGLDALGGNGGCLGLCNLSPAIAAAFQTFGNNNVGFTTNGNPYDAPHSTLDLGAAQSILGSAQVSYDAIHHQLSLAGNLNLDGTATNFSDSLAIDLSNVLGTQMYLGITGATGGSTSDERLLSFSVSPVPLPPGLPLFASAIAGLGLLGWRRRKPAG